MNALRIAALQGELSPHSAAPGADHGSVSPTVEQMLMRLSALEDCPIDKLRGWILRIPLGEQAAKTGRPVYAKSGAAYGSWTAQRQMDRILSPPEQRPAAPIRAHYSGSFPSAASQLHANNNSGRTRGWDVGPPHASSLGAGGLRPFPTGHARSAIDAARW